MKNKEIVELYATGNWILLAPSVNYGWVIVEYPQWNSDYVLVHKKHKHILDAYFDECEIYWESSIEDNVFESLDYNDMDFIESYTSSTNYEAVPKSLDNCYCEANELHYNKLEENGYYLYCPNYKNWDFMIIDKPPKQSGVLRISGDLSDLTDKHKKIQFNKELNEWTYCPYNEEKRINNGRVITRTNNTNNDIHTVNIADNSDLSKKMNNFNEYGFDGDFRGEILKEVDKWYIGYAWVNHQLFSMSWGKKDGECTEEYIVCDDFICKNYNLTPIEKEWYENENSVGKAFYDIVCKDIVIISWLDFRGNVKIFGSLNTYRHERFRPATKQEVDSLYYNKE